MATLAELVIKIIGDSSDFEKDAKSVKDKASKLGGQLSGVGKKLTLGLTVPILGAGVAAVSLASDMEESLSKVEVVFGDASSAVVDFSETASVNLGISSQAALEAAGTYGNLFTTMGLGQTEAAGMSTELLTLASDLASFNNLAPEQVLDKLRAGLIGEAEPLRAMGIQISAVATEAKAMELGLQSADGTLTEAAKLQARYAIILEQTTTAQGDFARTSDGLANSSRIAKAQLADLGAQMGQQLLPIAVQLVAGISQLITWFTNLSPATQKTIVMILGIVAVIGPLLIMLGSVISAVGSLTALLPVLGTVFGVLFSPIGLLIGAFLLLGFVINKWGADAWQTLTQIGQIIAAVFQMGWQKIQEFFGRLASINWAELGANIIQGIVNGVKSGLGMLAQVAADVGNTLMSGLKSVFGIASPAAVPMKEVGQPIGEGTGIGVGQGIDGVADQMGGSIMGALGQATSGAGGGGGGAGGGINVDKIEINNPTAEPASASVPRALEKLSFLGSTK